MTREAWWGLAVLIVQGLVSYAYRLFNGRLSRAEARLLKLEDYLDRINRRGSEREDQTQVWYGNVEIRLALIEQRLNGDTPTPAHPIRKDRTQWPR